MRSVEWLSLQALLEWISAARIQVPEFQREPVFDHEWVRSLLASVAVGYPIGAVMLLEAGNDDYRFGAKPIADVAAGDPEWYLVDGQQRCVALYEALASPDGRSAGHRYYVDPTKADDENVDMDDAIMATSGEPGASLVPVRRVIQTAEYQLPVLMLGVETTRWTIRMRGGRDGRTLSDRYRVRDP